MNFCSRLQSSILSLLLIVIFKLSYSTLFLLFMTVCVHHDIMILTMSLMKQRGMVFFQCSSLNTDIKLEQLVCITFPSASGLQTRTRMVGINRSSAQTSCAAASRHFLNINSWFNLSKAEVRREEKLSPWRVCRCPPPRRCLPRGRGCGWGWRGCPAPDPRAQSPGSSCPCSASSCSEISSPSRPPCPVCDPLKVIEHSTHL